MSHRLEVRIGDPGRGRERGAFQPEGQIVSGVERIEAELADLKSKVGQGKAAAGKENE